MSGCARCGHSGRGCHCARSRHVHAWVIRTDVPRELWCKICTGCHEVRWI